MKKELITQELEARGIPFHETEVTKGGVKMLGIVLELGKICPCIYPETIDDDSDVSKLIENIVDDEEGRNQVSLEVLEAVENFDKAKEHLRISLRPQTDDNDIVKKNYLDLESCLYMFFEEAAVAVKKEMIDGWGVPELEAWKVGMENTRDSITEVFNVGPMVAVGNKEAFKGSGALLFPDAFETYAEIFCDDLWLIPSSVHEILICSKSSLEKSEVIAMIQSVNEEEVEPQDRLANHPYIYGRFTNTITF